MNISASIQQLTKQLTNSMALSPSRVAASCAATSELPSILWNLKIPYRVHKSPPLVPSLNKINAVQTTQSYIFKIHLNIIHPPTSWFSQSSFPSGFPTNNPYAFNYSLYLSGLYSHYNIYFIPVSTTLFPEGGVYCIGRQVLSHV
jgi:hypothetical protein